MHRTRDAPIQVAIVGGGCAAMTAAFELTRPEHHGRYQVTVYQLGWRLGGKGASGRGPAGRIEEHGLHLWMGFYENAFGLLRECYGELGRDPRTSPIADWHDALRRRPTSASWTNTGGSWRRLRRSFPPSPASRAIRTSRASNSPSPTISCAAPACCAQLLVAAQPSAARNHGARRRVLREGRGESAQVRQAGALAAVLQGAVSRRSRGSLLAYSAGDSRALLRQRSRRTRGASSSRARARRRGRRLWKIIDMSSRPCAASFAFGLATDPRGFDAIDEYDCREWLLLNGASQQSLDSGFLRGLYDLGFAYEDGDPERPALAAGAGAARHACARSSPTAARSSGRCRRAWATSCSRRSTRCCARRGVRFEFFHRLENVRPGSARATASTPHVEALEFDVQAEIAGGGEYRPLVDVADCRAGRRAPDWRSSSTASASPREGGTSSRSGIAGASAATTLRVGHDFDFVVLGVGLGAVPHVCREIVARDPRWRAMVDHVKTVATQAFQVWLRDGHGGARLGRASGVNVSGFVEPFDTWADMRTCRRASVAEPPRAARLLLQRARRSPTPAADRVRPPPYPRRAQRAASRENAIRFLNRDIGTSGRGRSTRRRVPLGSAGPTDRRGSGPARRLRRPSSGRRTSIPSDRYTLSLPGSSAYRISPLDDTLRQPDDRRRLDRLRLQRRLRRGGGDVGPARRPRDLPPPAARGHHRLRPPLTMRRSPPSTEPSRPTRLRPAPVVRRAATRTSATGARRRAAPAACDNLVDELLAHVPSRVACGAGATTRRIGLRLQPRFLVGIGLDRDQLAAARPRAPGAHFVRMDATRLAFARESFDAVVCVEAALHFATRTRFLLEALRVLRPGGTLVVSDLLLARGTPLIPAENHLAGPKAYLDLVSGIGFRAVTVTDVTSATWRSYRRRLAYAVCRAPPTHRLRRRARSARRQRRAGVGGPARRAGRRAQPTDCATALGRPAVPLHCVAHAERQRSQTDLEFALLAAGSSPGLLEQQQRADGGSLHCRRLEPLVRVRRSGRKHSRYAPPGSPARAPCDTPGRRSTSTVVS